jgi:hypothetical protein
LLSRSRSGTTPREPAPGLSVTAAATFSEDPDLIAEQQEKAAVSVTPAGASDDKKKSETKPFAPAVPPSQPQPGRIPNPDPPGSASSAPISGFNSSAFSTTTTDLKSSSGGNPAAAGLMMLRRQVSSQSN